MMINPFISMMLSFSMPPFLSLLSSCCSVKLPWSEFGVTQKHLSLWDRSVCHTVAWLHTKGLQVITTHSLLCLEWPLLEFVAGGWRKTVNSSEVFFFLSFFLLWRGLIISLYHLVSIQVESWDHSNISFFTLTGCYSLFRYFHKALPLLPFWVPGKRGTFLWEKSK